MSPRASLTIGVYLGTGGEKWKSPQAVWQDAPDGFKPNAWVRIGRDDRVMVRVHHTEMGMVVHQKTDRRFRYGDLVEAAAKLPEPKQVVLKKAGQLRIIGKPAACSGSLPR